MALWLQCFTVLGVFNLCVGNPFLRTSQLCKNVGEIVPAAGGVVIATLGLSGNFRIVRYDFSLPHCLSGVTCSKCAVTSVRTYNVYNV
jgi:hypothetical protein